MIETFRNAWRVPELRRKLLFTLFIIIIYRVGGAVPVPYLDSDAIASWFSTNDASGNFFSYLNVLSGGNFGKATLLALSVGPYINAQIIIQLLTYALPPLERMQKEGPEGRKKLDRRTFDKGMGVIIKESGRLTGIVEELLDFSRIQTGRMVLINEKLDILAELDEVIYMLKDRAVNENKHLIYDEPVEVFPPVYGDRNRLKQVFINVIDNALKYTPEDGVVAIEIKYDKKTDADNIIITITDTGCGIPAEDLPKVKEKFYKANQKVNGSGIGLAVADEIMQLHKGKLDIESGVGVGTTVTITLPILNDKGSQNK